MITGEKIMTSIIFPITLKFSWGGSSSASFITTDEYYQ